MSTPNRQFRISWLFFSLVLLLWTEVGESKDIENVIDHEIAVYENPNRLSITLQKIDNEISPTKRIELIYPLLKTNNKEALNNEKQPYLWAALHGLAGNAFLELHTNNDVNNLEKAIEHYNKSLTVFTIDSFPYHWATAHNNLGNSYNQRIYGNRSDNIEKSIININNSLKVFNYDTFPKDWAMAQNNLAKSYYNRIQGNRGDNLELAIHYFSQSLRVRTRENFPRQWAMVQNDLANADRHGERSEGG